MLRRGWFEEPAWIGANKVLSFFATIRPDFKAMIRDVPLLLKTDFSSLRLPRYDYADQTEIDPTRVWLLGACAVHYNLDFGLVVRYVRGEYLATWRDTESILGAVSGLVSDVDIVHMRRILTLGCPAELNWEEPAENKEIFLERGNNPSVDKNKPVVTSTLNKEE